MFNLFQSTPVDDMSQRSIKKYNRKFAAKMEMEKHLGKLFHQPKTQETILKLVIDDMVKSETVYLSLLEECLFVLGPTDPQKEQMILVLLNYLPLPGHEKTIEKITTRIYQVIYELNIGTEIKYNTLLVLFFLSDVAIRVKQNSKSTDPTSEEDDDHITEAMEIYKHVFNNRMISLIWLLVNCSHLQTKILALCLIHIFLENFESPFPPLIEGMLEDHIRTTLATHKDPELRFMALYMAKHTFGKEIESRTEELTSAIDNYKEETGIGKIYIQPNPHILLNEHGLTLRNNTIRPQLATVTPAVMGLMTYGNWYWEITVCSLRFVKVGYCASGDGVIFGHVLNVRRPGEMFGIALYREQRIFRILSNFGEDISVPVEPNVNKFFPCVQIGPLQQVSFNFGKPLLSDNIPGVAELFPKKDKTKGNRFELLKELKSNFPPFEYNPPMTYRQATTLPLKLGLKPTAVGNPNLDEKSKKKMEKMEKMEKKNSSPKKESSEEEEEVKGVVGEEDEEEDDEVVGEGKGEEEKKETRVRKTESDTDDPSEFCCPITKSIMEVPVIAADGYTYEKESILKWLKDHNESPLTRQKMEHKKLVPNIRLKNEIQEWLKKKEPQRPPSIKILMSKKEIDIIAKKSSDEDSSSDDQ